MYAYLPEPNLELPKVPKQWLANVCATVLQDKFSNWVKAQVEARHEKVAVKKDVLITMDQEMLDIFKASTAVSSKCPKNSSLTHPYSSHSHQGRLSGPPTIWIEAPPHSGPDRGRKGAGPHQRATDCGKAGPV